MDEVGRGTGSFDGLSIALATIEYLHNSIACRTIFATHYHEMHHLTNVLPELTCARMVVQGEEDANSNEDLIFLHTIEPGVTHSSYGIHVARMAGIPSLVADRACSILNGFEHVKQVYQQQMKQVFQQNHNQQQNQNQPIETNNKQVSEQSTTAVYVTSNLNTAPVSIDSVPTSTISPFERSIFHMFSSIDPDHLSPKQAQKLIYELKQLVDTYAKQNDSTK
jgi:DNA mismatch repair protein MutS